MHYQQHLELMEPDEAWTPKHHVIFHMLFRADWLGNPRFYSAWRSEALNKVLKGSCRQVSQATFEATVLLKMARVLQELVSQHKRRAR